MLHAAKLSFMACVFALVFALAAPASQSQAADVTLRFANFPPASTFPCVSMDHWVAEVEKLTQGRVKVDTFPAGTLVDARSMVRGVMRGQTDIGCISMAYFPGMFPLMSAFELPLGFESAEKASVLLLQAILKFQPKELEKLKVLTAYTCPPAQVFSRKPVENLEAVKGLRLRAAGILADEVSLLGGTPVSMPQSEAPDAIQRGAVDGVFTSLDVVKDLNYAEPCRFGLLVNMSVYPFIVIMNRKSWEALPEDVKKVFDDLALPTAQWTGAYVDAHGQDALKWGKEKYGIDYQPLPAEERAKALEIVSPLVSKWEADMKAKNLPATEMLQFIRAGL